MIQDNRFLMLIEDDELDIMLIQQALVEMKFKNPVKVFNNGEQALNFLRRTSESPFLILSDINMPTMSGLELKQEIEKNEKLKKKSIPFIFLTTSSSEYDVEKAYLLNIHGFFTKPGDIGLWASQLDVVFKYWTSSLTPKRQSRLPGN